MYSYFKSRLLGEKQSSDPKPKREKLDLSEAVLESESNKKPGDKKDQIMDQTKENKVVETSNLKHNLI